MEGGGWCGWRIGRVGSGWVEEVAEAFRRGTHIEAEAGEIWFDGDRSESVEAEEALASEWCREA